MVHSHVRANGLPDVRKAPYRPTYVGNVVGSGQPSIATRADYKHAADLDLPIYHVSRTRQDTVKPSLVVCAQTSCDVTINLDGNFDGFFPNSATITVDTSDWPEISDFSVVHSWNDIESRQPYILNTKRPDLKTFVHFLSEPDSDAVVADGLVGSWVVPGTNSFEQYCPFEVSMLHFEDASQYVTTCTADRNLIALHCISDLNVADIYSALDPSGYASYCLTAFGTSSCDNILVDNFNTLNYLPSGALLWDSSAYFPRSQLLDCCVPGSNNDFMQLVSYPDHIRSYQLAECPSSGTYANIADNCKGYIDEDMNCNTATSSCSYNKCESCLYQNSGANKGCVLCKWQSCNSGYGGVNCGAFQFTPICPTPSPSYCCATTGESPVPSMGSFLRDHYSQPLGVVLTEDFIITKPTDVVFSYSISSDIRVPLNNGVVESVSDSSCVFRHGPGDSTCSLTITYSGASVPIVIIPGSNLFTFSPIDGSGIGTVHVSFTVDTSLASVNRVEIVIETPTGQPFEHVIRDVTNEYSSVLHLLAKVFISNPDFLDSVDYGQGNYRYYFWSIFSVACLLAIFITVRAIRGARRRVKMMRNCASRFSMGILWFFIIIFVPMTSAAKTFHSGSIPTRSVIRATLDRALEGHANVPWIFHSRPSDELPAVLSSCSPDGLCNMQFANPIDFSLPLVSGSRKTFMLTSETEEIHNKLITIGIEDVQIEVPYKFDWMRPRVEDIMLFTVSEDSCFLNIDSPGCRPGYISGSAGKNSSCPMYTFEYDLNGLDEQWKCGTLNLFGTRFGVNRGYQPLPDLDSYYLYSQNGEQNGKYTLCFTLDDTTCIDLSFSQQGSYTSADGELAVEILSVVESQHKHPYNSVMISSVNGISQFLYSEDLHGPISSVTASGLEAFKMETPPTDDNLCPTGANHIPPDMNDFTVIASEDYYDPRRRAGKIAPLIIVLILLAITLTALAIFGYFWAANSCALSFKLFENLNGPLAVGYKDVPSGPSRPIVPTSVNPGSPMSFKFLSTGNSLSKVLGTISADGFIVPLPGGIISSLKVLGCELSTGGDPLDQCFVQASCTDSGQVASLSSPDSTTFVQASVPCSGNFIPVKAFSSLIFPSSLTICAKVGKELCDTTTNITFVEPPLIEVPLPPLGSSNGVSGDFLNNIFGSNASAILFLLLWIFGGFSILFITCFCLSVLPTRRASSKLFAILTCGLCISTGASASLVYNSDHISFPAIDPIDFPVLTGTLNSTIPCCPIGTNIQQIGCTNLLARRGYVLPDDDSWACGEAGYHIPRYLIAGADPYCQYDYTTNVHLVADSGSPMQFLCGIGRGSSSINQPIPASFSLDADILTLSINGNNYLAKAKSGSIFSAHSYYMYEFIKYVQSIYPDVIVAPIPYDSTGIHALSFAGSPAVSINGFEPYFTPDATCNWWNPFDASFYLDSCDAPPVFKSFNCHTWSPLYETYNDTYLDLDHSSECLISAIPVSEVQADTPEFYSGFPLLSSELYMLDGATATPFLCDLSPASFHDSFVPLPRIGFVEGGPLFFETQHPESDTVFGVGFNCALESRASINFDNATNTFIGPNQQTIASPGASCYFANNQSRISFLPGFEYGNDNQLLCIVADRQITNDLSSLRIDAYLVDFSDHFQQFSSVIRAFPPGGSVFAPPFLTVESRLPSDNFILPGENIQGFISSVVSEGYPSFTRYEITPVPNEGIVRSFSIAGISFTRAQLYQQVKSAFDTSGRPLIAFSSQAEGQIPAVKQVPFGADSVINTGSAFGGFVYNQEPANAAVLVKRFDQSAPSIVQPKPPMRPDFPHFRESESHAFFKGTTLPHNRATVREIEAVRPSPFTRSFSSVTSYYVRSSVSVSSYGRPGPIRSTPTGIEFTDNALLLVHGESNSDGLSLQYVYSIPQGTTYRVTEGVDSIRVYGELNGYVVANSQRSRDADNFFQWIKYMFQDYPVEMTFAFAVPLAVIANFLLILLGILFRKCCGKRTMSRTDAIIKRVRSRVRR